MHIPAKHAEHNIAALCKFIRSNPLGLFTTAIKSPLYNTIQTSHVPFVLYTNDKPDLDELPVLRGHLARANPQVQVMIKQLSQNSRLWPRSDSTSQRLEDEVLILFNGPSHHYISPKFYIDTKPSTGKVVPTWDYASVPAYGHATVFLDSKSEETKDFLHKQLRDLSHQSETEIMGFSEPWKVDDAPSSYTDMLSKAIIGVEIEITKLEGRLKLSQDKPLRDREGVVEGLREHGTPDAMLMADLVEEQSLLKDRAESVNSR